MSVVVTGGAGFIGSCIIETLNQEGVDDIIVVDDIGTTDKWKNLVGKTYIEYIHKDEFFSRLNDTDDINHVIHMGACSSTTEKDFDYLNKNNFEYTKSLWQYCTKRQLCFIYASSAATYGSGEYGFSDVNDINNLKPLNGYGYSKQLFDLWAQKQEKTPRQYVGLKFFNVYGPNEYCKGPMASVVYHGYNQITETGELRLYKSYNSNYVDGGQKRDFIYIRDVCKVVDFFFCNSDKSGLFNVGTGKAETFEALGKAIFKALGLQENIRYVEMPENIREKYQYFTQAETGKLKETGFQGQFHSLEEGIADYVNNYLTKEFAVL